LRVFEFTDNIQVILGGEGAFLFLHLVFFISYPEIYEAKQRRQSFFHNMNSLQRIQKLEFIYLFFLIGLLIFLSPEPGYAQPSPPARVHLTTVAAGNQLDWIDGGNDGATTFIRYEVGRSTTRGGGYGVIGNSTGLTYTDTTATPGTTYYYVVRDVNSGGTTAWSSEVIRFYPYDAATIDAQIYKNETIVNARWIF
jgi:hypothetical protein